MDRIFKEYINLSQNLRNKYLIEENNKNENIKILMNIFKKDIPSFYLTGYSFINGTQKSIENQELMDFIPGFRLIHIEELEEEISTFQNFYNNNYFTFLADYGGCYIGFSDKEDKICYFSPENLKKISMYENLEKFFETIIRCYEKKIFFLDEDGYLDYDYDEENLLGKILNPNCEYWKD